MQASGSKSLPAIGFLSVLADPQQGLFGGYLILNSSGRPLEFHCTAPVKPNRAQEILYGATLRPYLYGEQIGKTLLAKAQQQPMFVCTNNQPVLAVRDLVNLPVVLVVDSDDTPDVDTPRLRLDAGHPGVPSAKGLHHFSLGEQTVAVAGQRQADSQAVLEHWQSVDRELDLGEPFSRIREAIEEAQRNAKK